MDDSTFTALSSALRSSTEQPIKALVTETLNLMIEAEFERVIGAAKSQRVSTRKGYRCGYRTRRFDTTCGTITLKIPHPKKGGYIPSFLKRYQRYETALKKTISDAYVNGVSTGRMKNLLKSMGVDGISKGQVSKITAGLNDTATEFRKRPLACVDCPVLYIDAIFEKILVDGKARQMAILTVIGANENNDREVIALEAMPDESAESYTELIKRLLQRGLRPPRLIVSDGAAGLLRAMTDLLPDTAWQRCRIHFIRNVLQSVRKADKPIIAERLMRCWYTSKRHKARHRGTLIVKKYIAEYPKAMICLRDGLEDTLTYMDFPEFKAKKIASSNVIECLNRKFRQRSESVGCFPNVESCLKLLTIIAMNQTEKWRQKS